MALVTVHAVVNVAADALMLLIRIRLRVAIRTREYRIVAGVCVARRAHPSRAAMLRIEPRMVKHRPSPPSHHLMARLATRREPRRNVIRVIRPQILFLMA
jgi:hypothetical protein